MREITTDSRPYAAPESCSYDSRAPKSSASKSPKVPLQWLLVLLGVMAFTFAMSPAGDAEAKQAQVKQAPNQVINFAAGKDDTDSENETIGMELADPLEPINRVIFAINDGIDFILIRPVAFVYRIVLPKIVRRSIGNFLSNVATPITLANDILQWEWERAENTFVRFLINTTGGLGGLDDLAARAGYPRHFEDFGQTLAVYGAPSGPYVVLPLLGPSTPRHIVGRVADIFVNPWTYILYDEQFYVRLIPSGVELINTRADNLETLDAIRSTSTDYYSSIKSIYWQNRQSEIANGRIIVDELPEIPN